MTPTKSREENVYLAKLAEQSERYDEMVEYMKSVVTDVVGELNAEERNLLSVAYKNVVGARRGAWRIVSSLAHKESAKEGSTKVEVIKQYKNEMLDDKLIPSVSPGGEPKTFYYKMKGDYYRYMAEFLVADERKETAENAMLAYKTATDAATTDLSPTHPVRLGLALNFSVFYYEILHSPERASRLAKSAFDDSIAELDSLPEESYKDSSLIMQLLRDNLTLWTSDIAQTGDFAASLAQKCETVEEA